MTTIIPGASPPVDHNFHNRVGEDHPDFQDGDFTRISSNDVRFKVPSQQLFMASAVLRNAPPGGHKLIHFTDPHLEYADILELFLRLILHFRLLPEDSKVRSHKRPAVSDTTFNRWVSLAGFLNGWECTASLRTFGLCVSEVLLRGHISACNAFIIGMLADDSELCISCLKVKGHLDSPLDVAGFEFRIWQHVKPKYLWALAEAGREAKDKERKAGATSRRRSDASSSRRSSKFMPGHLIFPSYMPSDVLAQQSYLF